MDDAPMVDVPGGLALIGENSRWSYPADGETPVRRVDVAPFRLDVHAVSNARFATFVAATGHVTAAEQHGWSFVFAGALPDDFPETRGVAAAPWWREVPGACWRVPEGGDSSLSGREDHPVVHIGAQDAAAFATWAGKRLPTEVEWEHAARGGNVTTFPWGDELEPGGEHRANVWQGEFPARNTCADGWYTTCPVDAFAPNGFGLHNMIGNVWEWTGDSFTTGSDLALLKGGSYLCHASYCRRYRPAARSGAAIDSSMGNAGFRCAADLRSTS
jgi:sulfatase modifying factor 1